MSGYRYWITFIDNYTRFCAVIFLKSKDHAFEAFQRYKAYAENHFGTKIKCMQIDKGGEYCYVAGRNGEGEHYCKVAGDCGKRLLDGDTTSHPNMVRIPESLT